MAFATAITHDLTFLRIAYSLLHCCWLYQQIGHTSEGQHFPGAVKVESSFTFCSTLASTRISSEIYFSRTSASRGNFFVFRLWPIEKFPVGLSHFQLIRDNFQFSFFFLVVEFRNILPQKIILSAYLMVLFSAPGDKTLSLFTAIKDSK